MVTHSCESNSFEIPLTGFWQRLGFLLQNIGIRIIRWDQLARQRRQLRELDDVMLKDIGLSRADVERIASRGFRDDPEQTGETIDERYRRGV